MSNKIITYFEPFEGRNENSSRDVAFSLDIAKESDVVFLPVSWDVAETQVKMILDSDPRFVFMLGEKNGLQKPEIELFAHNIMSGTDNYGIFKEDEKIGKRFPKELKTNINVDSIDYVNKSEDAGRYLCNYAYYSALKNNSTAKIIFIHVPVFQDKNPQIKEDSIKIVNRIVQDILENDDHFLIKLNDKTYKITEENVEDLYPDIEAQHGFPHIILSTKETSDGCILRARADGYVKVFEKKLENNEDPNEVFKGLYFAAAYYVDEQRHIGLGCGEFEVIKTFNKDEYYLLRGNIRRYVRAFICQADYKDELSFYKSLDVTFKSLFEKANDDKEKVELLNSMNYVVRLGMVNSFEILKSII